MKQKFTKILYKPFFVFLACLLFLLINLVFDKTLFQVFSLNQDLRIVKNRIQYLKKKNLDIEKKIKKSSDPNFVEQEARERLDYTGEGDLIFIFPENM